MPESSNPYLKWLGIRSNENPIDHYRLLGIERFENDTEVIKIAAERQDGHVRKYMEGKEAKAAKRILAEIEIAKSCLLNSDLKADYDRQLGDIQLGDNQKPIQVHL